jgi:hypothetical protein
MKSRMLLHKPGTDSGRELVKGSGSYAQKLLRLMRDTRQDVKELKKATKKQTDILAKLGDGWQEQQRCNKEIQTELCRIKNELHTVNEELQKVKTELVIAAADSQSYTESSFSTSANSQLQTTSQPQSLCSRCLRIQHYMSLEVHASYGENAGSFSASDLKYSHCEICRIVYKGLRRFARGVIPNDSELRIVLHAKSFLLKADDNKLFEGFEGITFFCAPGKFHSHRLIPLLLSIAETDLPCPWRVFPCPIRTSVGSLRLGSVSRANYWIQNCLSNHTCGNTEGNQLPSRVIDTGANQDEIRLFETNRCSGQYVCLSHCWGARQVLRTTSQNLVDHLQSLPWNELPETYRDAIRFTWQLGLRYLWIDSLCIVQDDSEDWTRESAVMSTTYQNSYLTIAATSARDATFGLCFGGDREILDLSGTTTAGTKFKVAGCKFFEHPSHPGAIYGIENHWPLMRRAWAFQERLLSPRVVHFCRVEMIWECKEQVLCECGEITGLGKQDHHRILKGSTREKLIQQWHDLVGSYSQLGMSFESDKLPALSGLAAQMAARRPEATYLAGLWSDSLDLDLLWINLDAIYSTHAGRSKAQSSWRAPSWSWAAIDASVVFPLSKKYYTLDPEHPGQIVDTYFTVTDAWTCLTSSNKTGQLKSASLSISGQMFAAEISVVSTGNGLHEANLSLNSQGTDFTNDFLASDVLYVDVPSDPFYLDRDRVSGTIHCLRMARVRRKSMYGNKVTDVEYALVLRLPTGSTAYERVGMVVQERESTLCEVPTPLSVWKHQPSCFETGSIQQTIIIM